MDEKAIKEEFKKKAQKNPEKYYPINFLKERGFVRKKCSKCGNFFWTLDSEREICGDPICIGGYAFIGKKNTSVKLDFIASWKLFSKIFKKLGYKPIPRYPVLARWRDDLEFVIASIADFQPYVVNGIVEPPANPLVVPQFCLRFTDIDNVGYTGRHYTGFVMIGQHAFVPKHEYDKEKYLSDIHYWLTHGMGIKEEEIIYHEDVWAGGGNLGPSMEFFSRGLEIGNQVYMEYDITSGDIKDLNISVLDMGMGQERVAWFSQGSFTSYEANFPTVMRMLYEKTGIKPDHEVWDRFLPLSALLNIDEVADIDKVWFNISQRLGMDMETLKEKIEPLAGLYAVAEHSRTLLFAISDGAILSNVGGGYNLRVIARRCFDIIRKFSFSIDIYEIMEEHAKYLKKQYPELMENLESVRKIIDVEYKKYLKSKETARNILSKYKNKKITVDEMIMLYDTYGISPQILKEEKLIEKIPDNFYVLVSQMHKDKRSIAKAQTKRDLEITLENIPETKILYWGDWKLTSFEARVLEVHDNYVILDRTAFYPTSGGQLHDTGWLIIENGKRCFVRDVLKKDNYVVHVVDHSGKIKRGMKVRGEVDFERRKQLTQHHTATHILNDACRKVLGNHIWQAGAEKTMEKARLDVTHYELPTFEEVQAIERVANEIIQKDLPVEKMIVERNIAEKEYGFRIYQGGAPPGKYLRIVKIGDDVEACGGTHLNSTLEANFIKIISVSKLQDGVIRFEFVAGKRAVEYVQEMERILHDSSQVFSVSYKHLPSTAKKFFEEWKSQRKEIERLKEMEILLLKDKILRNVKEEKDMAISYIRTDVDIKNVMRAFDSIKEINISALVIEREKDRIIISKKDNAREIAKLIFNVSEKNIKGKNRLAIINK